MTRLDSGLQANDDSLLLDYVRRLVRFRKGRRAVRVRMSRLQPRHRGPQHLRIAASTFEALIRKFDGAAFRLCNDDLMVVCKGARGDEMEDCVLRLRGMLSEDPFFSGGEPFCDWFDLETDYAKLLSQAEESVEERSRFETGGGGSGDARPAARASEAPPLEAGQLASVIGALANADLSSVLRRQPVCAVVRGVKPARLFTELYVSMDALGQAVMPTHDLRRNRWLFQELKRHLDRRVMIQLTHRRDPALGQPFSLNLNVETLVTREFLDFDATFNTATRRTIVIELQLFDVIADLGSFLFARNFLHDRGYRLCLDGGTNLNLPFFDREKLGFDLVKLQWRTDLIEGRDGRQAEGFGRAVAAAGPERLILCHCDCEAAMDFGRALGIHMYQGRHVDRRLAASSTREETAQVLTEANARNRAAMRG
jgi:hypothetical protein